jgi:hypothetical protein
MAVASCGNGVKTETIKVLSRYGLKGIDPSWVVNVHSCPAISADYKNKTYFVILRADPIALSQFVAANNFKKQDVLTVPTQENKVAGMPKWWNPPRLQTECYSTKLANASVTIARVNDEIFLFCQD